MTSKVLVLRTASKDRQSHGGFQWPESGPVEAPDWDPTPECGGGLHGALWGEGDGRLFNWDSDAIWQVVEVDADSVIDLDGKVKFPRGTVVYSGNREGALKMILSHPGGMGRAIIGATVTAGTYGRVTVGDYGTASAGHHGTARAGVCGKAIVKDCGTATAGVKGTAIAENWGTATAGKEGTATVKYGTATAGDLGIAIAGDQGTAIVGHEGTATAGDFGMAIAGHGGKATTGIWGGATAGDGGTAITGDHGMAQAGSGGKASTGDQGSIHIKWYDRKAERLRLSTGYIGENGLEPNTLYKIDDKGNFVLAE